MPTMLRARERGHKVSAVYSPRFAQAYPQAIALAHQSTKVDTSNQAALTEAIESLGRDRQVDAVLVHRDAILAKVAVACRENAVRFSSVESLAIALNKSSTRRLLQQNGLSNVRFQHARTISEIRTAVQTIGFPCVLKPAGGHGSKLAFKIRNHSQLASAEREMRSWIRHSVRADRWLIANGFICEEWVRGPIISVELAVVDRKCKTIAVALGTSYRENPCAGLGNVIPFDTNPGVAYQCIEFSEQVCALIGLDCCVCDLEMVWTSSGPVLLEANPRKMGGEMPLALELATGVNFNDIILDTYAGKVPAIERIKHGYVTVIRKVMPTKRGRVRANSPQSWFDSFVTREATVRFCNDALHTGTWVRAFQVLGRILVVCKSAKLGFRVANEAVRHLQGKTRLQFVTGKLPVLNIGIKRKGRTMTTPDPSPAASRRGKRKKTTAKKKSSKSRKTTTRKKKKK
jgi:biotin carboxylase